MMFNHTFDLFTFEHPFNPCAWFEHPLDPCARFETDESAEPLSDKKWFTHVIFIKHNINATRKMPYLMMMIHVG